MNDCKRSNKNHVGKDGKIYKDCGVGLDLYVSHDGDFIRNGKTIKVVKHISASSGRKQTAKISVMHHGKSQYFQASKLVAKAWCYGYKEDCYVIYKDGDLHNISADNLQLTDKDGYYEYIQRNSGHTAKNMEQRIEKLDMVIAEATLTKDFLTSRNFDAINRHVENRLLPILNDYCRRTIHLGIETTKRIVPEAIARMYEVIDNDMCLYNYERWLKKILLQYKKNGSFGFTGKIPKPIYNKVQQLNLDCLAYKYNISKLK